VLGDAECAGKVYWPFGEIGYAGPNPVITDRVPVNHEPDLSLKDDGGDPCGRSYPTFGDGDLNPARYQGTVHCHDDFLELHCFALKVRQGGLRNVAR